MRGSDNGAHGIAMHSCDVEYESVERIYRQIDCGGDENFVRDWIMGDPVIFDLAVLVVDATDGPTPQTREHILLARQTGTPVAVVFNRSSCRSKTSSPSGGVVRWRRDGSSGGPSGKATRSRSSALAPRVRPKSRL